MVGVVAAPWYLDQSWRFDSDGRGGTVISVPHPLRAGLSIDTDRQLDVRSAAAGYAVFAYRDEDAATYGLREYQIPRRLFVLWRLPMTPFPVALELLLEDGQWLCQQLVVARQPGGPPITQEKLKQISLRKIAVAVGPRAADRLVQKVGGGLERRIAVLTPGGSAKYLEAVGRAGNPRSRKRLDRSHLEEVADFYRQQVDAGARAPVYAVAEHFQIERSTAGAWISKCRKEGVLGPVRRGSRGERRAP